MKKFIHNNFALKDKRKYLRNNSTSAEATLWKYLSNSQLGRKFRRQHSVGPYILDFYCPKEKLAIELDGEVHYSESAFEKDKVRTEYLNALGIRVLRFENRAVFESIEWVLDEIRKNFKNDV